MPRRGDRGADIFMRVYVDKLQKMNYNIFGVFLLHRKSQFWARRLGAGYGR